MRRRPRLYITGNKVRYEAEMTSTLLLVRMRAEVVSRVLDYQDTPQLQEVVRAIRRALRRQAPG